MSFELLLTEDAICTDKDGKVVACDSEDAAFQVVGKGAPISAEDAARYGAKTKKADTTNYTLRIDSHTIARTPEEKAFAATQPQMGLQLAKAEEIRTSANLAVASLNSAAAAKAAEAAEEAAKTDAEADKKAKAAFEGKADKPKK